MTEDGEWQRLEKYRPRIKSDKDWSDMETIEIDRGWGVAETREI